MEIQLNRKLKELRREKGNTQEELAKYMDISVQAVSKWERGDGFPDINLLPKLSAYYGVSIDTLLGVDDEAKNVRIQEITDEYNAIRRCQPNSDGTLVLEHGIDDGIELIRNAVHEFPDCWFFLQLLASDLWWRAKSLEGKERTLMLAEAEDLCDRIMNKCTENRWRSDASSILCMIYIETGRTDKAIENASDSAGFVDTVDWKLSKIYQGEELKKQLRRNIRELTRLLYLSIKQMKDEGGNFEFVKSINGIDVQFDEIREAFEY